MAICSITDSARRLAAAVFLLSCIGGPLRAADDSFHAPDMLILKDGTVVRGLIIKNTWDSVLIQEKFKEGNYPKSRIVRIVDNADTESLYTDINRQGRLPSWRVIANDLRTHDAIKSLVEIPATVIDNGDFKNVPYKSFRVNNDIELNIYGDPEAAQIVFQAGWPLTMVGLDVGDKTLLGRKHLEQLARTHGPVNDFIYSVAKFLVELSEKFGDAGTPMYDPLAVGVAIDATLVTAPPMHVDVETRGEFTRGETVANRRGEIERNVLHGDRYIIEGIDKVQPNAKVCIDVQADRFLQLFVSRIQGK
jgi:hypothetical protein